MKSVCYVVVLLTIVCVTTGQSQTVKVDWRRGTDFKAILTYAWNTSLSPAKDAFWNREIMRVVDSALARKGVRKVEFSSGPDVVVTYSAALEDDAFMMGWEGRLAVDIRQPPYDAAIWHGVVTDLVFDRSHKNTAAVQKMIAKMFRQYPPGK